MIEIKNLKKSFGDLTVLQNVSFNIEDGESVVIIGGSGCGKSTLLRCINRLIVPEEGEILIDGVNIMDRKANVDEIRRSMGMVYQQFNLFDHLNVMENMILAPMKVLKMSQEEAIAKAEEKLAMVGMSSHRYQMPSMLSGGQKQRVAIARTLMMEPKVILFDEPTSALDPTMVDEVEKVIRVLIDNGMTSIIVTHEMRFAKSIASKIVFLAEKGVYEMGPPSQIFDAPRRELTRQFIYRARLLTKEIDGEFDYYSLVSELKKFIMPYGLTMRQQTGLSYLVEELLLPQIKLCREGKCTLTAACSETGAGHKLIFRLHNYTLPELEIDEISKKLIVHYTDDLKSVKDENGDIEITAVL